MANDWSENLLTALIPLAVVITFIAFYIAAQALFIKCSVPSIAECQKVSPGLIFAKAPEPVVDDTLVVMEKEGKQSTSASQMTMAIRYRDRFVWVFAAMAQVLFGIGSIGFFYLVIGRSLKHYLGSIFISLTAIILGIFIAYLDDMPIAAPIYQQTIEGSLSGGMKSIVFITKTLNAVAFGATASAVFAVSAVLYSPAPKPADLDTQMSNVSGKLDDLRSILYVSTILLVLGMLRMISANNWNLGFILPEATLAATAFFTGLTGMLGGFYTLLLGGLFIPTAFLLKQRAHSYLRNASLSPADQKTRLTEAGFSFSISNSLPRLLVITAPLLAGGVLDILSKVSTVFAP